MIDLIAETTLRGRQATALAPKLSFYGLAVSSRSSIVYMINITDFTNFWKRISSTIGALICAIAMNFVQCDTGASLATSNMGADGIIREMLDKKSKIFLMEG